MYFFYCYTSTTIPHYLRANNSYSVLYAIADFYHYYYCYYYLLAKAKDKLIEGNTMKTMVNPAHTSNQAIVEEIRR